MFIKICDWCGATALEEKPVKTITLSGVKSDIFISVDIRFVLPEKMEGRPDPHLCGKCWNNLVTSPWVIPMPKVVYEAKASHSEVE